MSYSSVISGVEARVRLGSYLTDTVKIITYWPRQAEHEDEGGLIAWSIFLGWIVVGCAGSTQNVFFGLGLASAGLYGSALVRYLLA